MKELLLVTAGGGLGSALRYGTGLLVGRVGGTALPWGTLTVNLVGSFALAWLLGSLGDEARPGLKLFLGVGVLGGFTTYSTFNLDVLRLFEAERTGAAIAYLSLTLVGCLFAGGAGWLLARS